LGGVEVFVSNHHRLPAAVFGRVPIDHRHVVTSMDPGGWGDLADAMHQPELKFKIGPGREVKMGFLQPKNPTVWDVPDGGLALGPWADG